MVRFRKVTAAALVLSMLLVPGWGCAEDLLPEEALSNATLEELYALRDRVENRIEQIEQEQYSNQVYESGSYAVGGDMPAGYYVVQEADKALFSSLIIRSDQDESGELLAYELITNQAVVRLVAGTYVTLTDAVAYTIDSAPECTLESMGTLGEGGYWVGLNLDAGTYTISPTEKAPLSTYSIFDGVLGTDAQLVKFEKILEPMQVQLETGQYIEISGCTLTA